MTKFIATAKFSSLRIREATSIPMLDSAIPVSSTAPRKLSQSPKLKLTLKTQASGVRTMAKKSPIRVAASALPSTISPRGTGEIISIRIEPNSRSWTEPSALSSEEKRMTMPMIPGSRYLW